MENSCIPQSPTAKCIATCANWVAYCNFNQKKNNQQIVLL